MFQIMHVGAMGLPRIIGGTDLEIHSNKPRKELEDWFREETQVKDYQPYKLYCSCLCDYRDLHCNLSFKTKVIFFKLDYNCKV